MKCRGVAAGACRPAAAAGQADGGALAGLPGSSSCCLLGCLLVGPRIPVPAHGHDDLGGPDERGNKPVAGAARANLQSLREDCGALAAKNTVAHLSRSRCEYPPGVPIRICRFCLAGRRHRIPGHGIADPWANPGASAEVAELSRHPEHQAGPQDQDDQRDDKHGQEEPDFTNDLCERDLRCCVDHEEEDSVGGA